MGFLLLVGIILLHKLEYMVMVLFICVLFLFPMKYIHTNILE